MLFAAIFGLGFFAPRLIFSGNSGAAHAAYWGYAALWGAFIAPVIAFYLGQAPGVVVQALGITAVTFAATSLVGYTTKRDLSGFGTFFLMASIGLILAILANAIFFQRDVQPADVGGGRAAVLCGGRLRDAGDQGDVLRGRRHDGRQAEVDLWRLHALRLVVTLFVNILNILGIMRSE